MLVLVLVLVLVLPAVVGVWPSFAAAVILAVLLMPRRLGSRAAFKKSSPNRMDKGTAVTTYSKPDTTVKPLSLLCGDDGSELSAPSLLPMPTPLTQSVGRHAMRLWA